jgi:hypothetical protein
METSIFLARLIGPMLGVMGLGLVIDPRGFQTLANEFVGSRALIFLAGLLAFVPGLAVVLAHNVWVADWPVIITALGWLALVGGAFRILMPRQVARIARGILGRNELVRGAGVMTILIGTLLMVFGFLA